MKTRQRRINRQYSFHFSFLRLQQFALRICGSSGAITKKIVIVTPSEPDTLDLNSTKMPGISAPVAENITERLIGITTTES